MGIFPGGAFLISVTGNSLKGNPLEGRNSKCYDIIGGVLMIRPGKVELANTPTPIHSLRETDFVKAYKNVYIKRDDYTGVEVSGNKIRKLEFIVQDALDKGEEVLITCGGLQSNHCRATAAVAARLGLKCHLVVSGETSDNVGNNALDQIFGAEMTFVAPADFGNYMEIMEYIKQDYENRGLKARTITIGASDPVGTLGYFSAFEEILEQEKALGIEFDTICTTVGSAGTYAGLYLGNQVHEAGKNIVGINIYDKNNDYVPVIKDLVRQASGILQYEKELNLNQIHLMEYAHTGYGQISEQNAEYIKDFAKDQGVLLDPVYTGKAFYGIVQEIQKDNPLLKGNVLFIHTGGIFGALARTEVYLK